MKIVNNMTMIEVNIANAKAHLSEYIQRVENGETIVLTRRNRPVAELRPLRAGTQTTRPVGLCKGEFRVPDDFDAPLPEDILRAFEGR